MIDLNENLQHLQALEAKLKEVGESLWHNRFSNQITRIRTIDYRT